MCINTWTIGNLSPHIFRHCGASTCFPRCFRDSVHNRIPCASAGWKSILTQQIYDVGLPILVIPVFVVFLLPFSTCNTHTKCAVNHICAKIRVSLHSPKLTDYHYTYAKSPYRSTTTHVSFTSSPLLPVLLLLSYRNRCYLCGDKTLSLLSTALHCSQSTRAPSLSQPSSSWSRIRVAQEATDVDGMLQARFFEGSAYL